MQIITAANSTRKSFRLWDRLHQRWFYGSTTEKAIKLGTDAISLFGETIVFGSILHDPHDDDVWKNDPKIKSSLDVLDYLLAVQNTGVLDEDGRFIYEGDIVQFGELRGVVMYNAIVAGFQMWTNFKWVYCNLRESKIIGNIFENPELMK